MDLFSISWWRNFYTRVGRQFSWGCVLVIGVPLVVGFGWNQFSQPDSKRAASQEAVIGNINGQTVTQGQYLVAKQSVQQFQQLQEARGMPPQDDFALTQGRAVEFLVSNVVREQIAKQRNIRVADADIDKQLTQEREARVGKNASDNDWETYVQTTHNQSVREYREALANDPGMLSQALRQNYKNAEKVTDEEVKKQSSEVQIRTLLISTRPLSTTPGKPTPKALTDEEAKKKAEDLLSKVKAGGNLAALAKANSSDFFKEKGGDMGFMVEYPPAGMQQFDLRALYGKEFLDAVQNTATGQLTPVIKASGFVPGYMFAKVENRRNNLPKDFDMKKAAEALKQQRGDEKLNELFEKQVKAAKITFTNDGSDAKAYYDYAKLQEMTTKLAGLQPDAPTQAEVDKQKAMVDAELEALLKKNPGDGNVAMIVAKNLKARMDKSPAEAVALRDRLIQLDEVALSNTTGVVDRNTRFELARLYVEKTMPDKAFAQLQKISRLLAFHAPEGRQELEEYRTAHAQLAQMYRTINKNTEAEEADKRVADLSAKIVMETKKEEAERKMQQDLQKQMEKINKQPQTPKPGSKPGEAKKPEEKSGSSAPAGKGADLKGQPSPASPLPGTDTKAPGNAK